MLETSVGAGVTLSGLFGEWPRDRLAEIYSEPREPDRSRAVAFFRLNEGEPEIRSMALRQIVRLARFVLGRGETSTFLLPRMTARLRRWLDRFDPEVVFSQLGGLPMGRLTLAIARERRIPLVLHVSDDWVPGWPANVIGRPIFPLTHIANRAMRAVMEEAMRVAASVTVISEEMASDYERRYGRRSRVLYNGIDLAEWPARAARPSGSPARILYSGSIFGYGQRTSLGDIAEAVAALDAAGTPARLVVHSQHSTSAGLERASGVELRPLVPRSELASNLAGADVLVLPVNFDPVTRDFIRLSMPGKLAEYLASGTPLLYYGPPDVAQARFAARNSCAFMLTERDPAQLRGALRRIMEDARLRDELVRNARVAAEKCFDIQRLRAELNAAIAGALVATGAE